jgi:hypothetical protein
MKYGNLNFLETPGPLQACNGTAFPLQMKQEKLGGLCRTGQVGERFLSTSINTVLIGSIGKKYAYMKWCYGNIYRRKRM